jgi:hypothetical protein
LRFEHNKINFEVNFYLMGKTNCKEAWFTVPTNRQKENWSADVFVGYQKRDTVCFSWHLVSTWIINVHAVWYKPVQCRRSNVITEYAGNKLVILALIYYVKYNQHINKYIHIYKQFKTPTE